MQLIEKYIHDVGSAVWDLDKMHSRLVESLDSNDKTTIREFLADQMGDSNSLLNRVKPLLEHGNWIMYFSVVVNYRYQLFAAPCGLLAVLSSNEVDLLRYST